MYEMSWKLTIVITIVIAYFDNCTLNIYIHCIVATREADFKLLWILQVTIIMDRDRHTL